MEFKPSKCATRQLRLPKRNPLTGVWHEFERLRLEDVQKVKRIGEGGYGTVDLVTVRGKPSRTFALKTVVKKTGDQKFLKREKTILAGCGDSEFIVKLFKTFQTMEYDYFLMEYCQGGDLQTMVEKCGPLGEKASRFYMGCTVEALGYLHRKGIVHRDLKPLNLMLDGRGYIKLIDFGFAKNLNGGRTNTRCGTSIYMAPEVILGKMYDGSADLWSLGVTAFQLISGRFPFDDGRDLHTEESLLNARQCIRFPAVTMWTLPAVCLIRDLLKVEASERIGHRCGMSEVKSHEWFRGFDWESLQACTMPPPVCRITEDQRDHDNLWPDF